MEEDSKAIEPAPVEASDSGRRRLLFGQITLILIVWLYPAFLHRHNDGLWFQGDSPRHAANGIFWKDFLTSGSLDPRAYALAYYARYPVITPAAYPPAFYLVEGLAFAFLHPSPYVAKSIVLLFSLGAAIYLLAYIRRWISINAGWSAALLLLLPGFVLYSNAVMLNVPATAAAIAALYHARRWIESSREAPEHKHFYLAAAFSLFAALTYLPTAIVGIIIAAWLLAGKRWDLAIKLRTWITALICVGALLPWIWVSLHWAPIQASFVTESYRQVGIAGNWIIYAKMLAEIAGHYVLVLAAAGIVLALFNRRWRKEIGLLGILFLLDYLFLTVLAAREGRYALLLCMPVVCCCGIVCDSVGGWISRRVLRPGILPHLAAALLGIGLAVPQGIFAAKTKIARVHGFEEAVSYIETLAPSEAIFYEGFYEGNFTFYLQSRDPDFRRRVVVGRKLLYANAMNALHLYQQFVSSTEDVIRILKTQGGCRYIVLEIGRNADQVPVAKLLQQMARAPEFVLMRSFPLSGPGVERIDVYRFDSEISPVDEVDLVYPALGSNARFKVRPIRR